MKFHTDTTGGYIKIDGVVVEGISPGSLPFPKPSRDTKDVTTTKDTVHKKGMKLLDPGTASVKGVSVQGDPGQQAMKAASLEYPAQEHTIQVIIPENGTTYEYQAYVSTDYPSEEDENTLTFNVDFEATGGFKESTTYAGITSIEGTGSGIKYYPSTANSALPTDADDVIFMEANGITTDTVEVTAAAASYIGISYDGGSNWTKLTSGTGASFSSTKWPAAGNMSKALIMVQEDEKATRFVNLFITQAAGA